MFDGKNTKKIEYLEDERKKLWERLIKLEKIVAEKPSDTEKEAKEASKKTAEYRNKAETRLNESNSIHSEINAKKNEIEKKILEIDSNYTRSLELTNNLIEKSDKLTNLSERITKVLEEHPDIEDEIEQLDDLIKTIEENSSKANTTYKGILSKKTEIDELHREILGYEDEDEDGDSILVEGLKQKLENSYDKLSINAQNLETKIEELGNKSKTQYDEFIQKNQENIDRLKLSSKNEYDAIKDQIESLLPSAMTAGLSSAFVTKKNEEELLYKEHKRNFNNGILYISLSALLPIAISVFYFVTENSTLTDTIERAPKIMLAFLPLYVPLIWTTISANIKVNLSKRLIEEYSHKQVLSMTIEGLSKQIENIEDYEMSEELRIKLLNNFLNVTSENPGKLISDYQKSDNPILNFFDRRKKNNSTTIVDTLTNSTKEIIETAADKIENGITNTGEKF